MTEGKGTVRGTIRKRYEIEQLDVMLKFSTYKNRCKMSIPYTLSLYFIERVPMYRLFTAPDLNLVVQELATRGGGASQVQPTRYRVGVSADKNVTCGGVQKLLWEWRSQMGTHGTRFRLGQLELVSYLTINFLFCFPLLLSEMREETR